MVPAKEEEEKEQFFAALHHLDDLSDDATCVKRSRPSPKMHSELPDQAFSSMDHPLCSLSARDTRPTEDHPPRRTPSLRSGRSACQEGLRSRIAAVKLFADCVFYFIPNNDIAGPRKRRIQKALLNGATWETDTWQNGGGRVTHIIVDSSLTKQDVLKALQLDRIPENIELVNDVWLTESIGFGELRDTDASRFLVKDNFSNSKPALNLNKIPTALFSSDPEKLTPEDLIARSQPPAESVEASEAESEDEDNVFDHPSEQNRDTLDEIIDEVKGTMMLPVKLDDEIGAFNTSSDSDSENYTKERLQSKPKARGATSLHGFACMRKNDGIEKCTSPNAGTIEILQQMATYYDRIGDNWRTLAYRKGMAVLSRENKLIASREEALRLPQIGERLAAKIEEIVTTQTLRRLENTKTDPTDQLLQLFMGIYQVGYPLASKWIMQGHRTLEDLKDKADLTANQRIGIDHYYDFLQRIPRSEVTRHANTVRRAVEVADPEMQVIVGGSYRRGNLDSGDIDLIFTKKGATLDQIRTILQETVIPKLQQDGFLKAALAGGTAKAAGGSKWHGACALPSGVWRRIDFLFVPWCELGAALIYFTGNDIFNRSIRLLASRKGMRLNQHGLYGDVMRGQRRERITEGKLIEGQSEKRIFEILGVPWRPPHHRKC